MAFQNRHDPSDALTYGELKAGTKDKRSGFFQDIVAYPCFKGSLVEVYTCAFLEMLNSLNILSLIHRGRNTPDYLVNLESVKDQLVALLKNLQWTICKNILAKSNRGSAICVTSSM